MINFRAAIASREKYDRILFARGRGVVGSTCGPVKAEIAGSSPVVPAPSKKSS